MNKANKSYQQNDLCCNNCGSVIKHVQRVIEHLCKSLAKGEPDMNIYISYDEPICTNCTEMSEVISKAEFADRVNALYLKIYADVENEEMIVSNSKVDSSIIDCYRDNEKTMLN